MNTGEKIYTWIKARHADGMTVYAQTYTRITKIAPKHADRVRYHNRHCEMTAGRSWVSLNGCNFTARKD